MSLSIKRQRSTKRGFFMRNAVLLTFMLICLLVGCDTAKEEQTVDKPGSDDTFIIFDNTNGTSAAVVYSSSLRTDDSKIAEIPAGQISQEFEWTAGSLVPFFLSYKLNLTGINDFTLDYTPKFGNPEFRNDQIYIRIDSGKKTVISIPSLSQTIVLPADPFLTDNSYIFIQNISSSSIGLLRGNAVLPDNFSNYGINPGERAHYTLKSTDIRTVSSYKLSTTERGPISLPDPDIFEQGHVYSYIYDGSNFYISKLEIKLRNVVVGSLEDSRNETYVRFRNNSDFSVSVYTNRLRNVNHKIPPDKDIAAGSMSEPILTTPNISGAFFPTYNIIIEDVSIPYEGEVIVAWVEAGKTHAQPNDVYIRSTDNLAPSEREKPLSNSVYIKVHNDVDSSLSLRQGSGDVRPHGSTSHVVNPGFSATYIVNAGAVSNFSFRQNTTDPIPFPSNVTQFESGRLYSFRYDGTVLELLTERPLTIDEALKLSPPENIHARTLPNGHIALSWNKVGIETGYKIWRSEGSHDNFEQIGSTNNTSFTDGEVVLGNTYYYKLVSVRNNRDGGLSINYASALAEESSLAAPTGLTASVEGINSIELSWNPVSGAISYMIFRGYTSGNINTYITTTTANQYKVEGLEQDTDYYFTVSALSERSESYRSNPVNAKTDKSIDVEMVRISGGTFTRGSWDSLDNNASPSHQVTLGAFWIGKYEVTQDLYEAITGVNPSHFNGSTGREPAADEEQGKRPVENITWFDAIEFCNKLSERKGLTPVYTISGRTPGTGYPITAATVTVNWSADGYRLPTEAEWEYACRAGTTTGYNTGNTISDNTGWYWSNSLSRTREVGKKPPNALGLYDMHGNVYEWCWDWFGAYLNTAQTDPRGATSGTMRVVRGGSWYSSNTRWLRSACRNDFSPFTRNNETGFRLVRN